LPNLVGCCSIGIREDGSSLLRSTFGPPIRKIGTPPSEVFTVRPGIEMTVTYSTTDNKVCKLEIPSGLASNQQVDQILEQVVPVSTRGKKGNEMQLLTGIAGSSSIYYERVILIRSIFTSQAIKKNPGAIVIFKDKLCGWEPGDPFDQPPQPEPKPTRKQ
jgi:hypothetical protein